MAADPVPYFFTPSPPDRIPRPLRHAPETVHPSPGSQSRRQDLGAADARGSTGLGSVVVRECGGADPPDTNPT